MERLSSDPSFGRFAGVERAADIGVVRVRHEISIPMRIGADDHDPDPVVEADRTLARHRRALALAAPEALPAHVRDMARPGDYIVFLGAGNITQWAYALPGQLADAGAGA